MVGNGVTNWEYDTTNAYIDMAYWHSLIDTQLHDAFVENNCDFKGPYMRGVSDVCWSLFDEFNSLVAEVNVYDIFGVCYGSWPYPQLYASHDGKQHRDTPLSSYTPWLHHGKPSHMLKELPPCTFGTPILDYLNLAEVRAELHIPSDIQAWDLCTSDIEYVIQPKGSQWIYEALAGKYRMLHYSGDIDGAVPTIGTQNWIASLDWEVTSMWRPYMVENQVAGYLESYADTLTFATVHGAGHMAPQFKRPQTYHLIFNWVNQTKI